MSLFNQRGIRSQSADIIEDTSEHKTVSDKDNLIKATLNGLEYLSLRTKSVQWHNFATGTSLRDNKLQYRELQV
jgi:aryl carrier-like protein